MSRCTGVRPEVLEPDRSLGEEAEKMQRAGAGSEKSSTSLICLSIV